MLQNSVWLDHTSSILYINILTENVRQMPNKRKFLSVENQENEVKSHQKTNVAAERVKTVYAKGPAITSASLWTGAS